MPKLQHIRSATPDKRPDPALLADGQLSINTAAATPGVYTKNDAGGLIKVGPTYVGSAAPNSSPSGSVGNSVGEHWMDTSVAPPVLRVWDGASWIASQGLAGPQGEVGPQGPQGPAGNDGAAGPQGPAGNDGAVGPQGPAGVDGGAGSQGPQGEVGPQGPPGADGAAGGQGPAGADGVAGPQGPAGADGVAGPQGPAGNDGAAGPQGPAGADGAAGAQGPPGPNAVSADAGNVIITGSDGLVYTSRNLLAAGGRFQQIWVDGSTPDLPVLPDKTLVNELAFTGATDIMAVATGTAGFGGGNLTDINHYIQLEDSVGNVIGMTYSSVTWAGGAYVNVRSASTATITGTALDVNATYYVRQYATKTQPQGPIVFMHHGISLLKQIN